MISVVVPSLYRPYLVETIKSIIIQQNIGDIYIIPGSNPAAQRNEGLSKVNTVWTLFCDDDMILPPSTFAKLMAYAEKAHIVYPTIKGTYISKSDSFLSGCVLCRTVVAKTLMWDEELIVGEDLDFAWRALEKRFTVHYARDVVVYHPGPVSVKPGAGIKSLAHKHPDKEIPT